MHEATSVHAPYVGMFKVGASPNIQSGVTRPSIGIHANLHVKVLHICLWLQVKLMN